jgi:hypothetical protein
MDVIPLHNRSSVKLSRKFLFVLEKNLALVQTSHVQAVTGPRASYMQGGNYACFFMGCDKPQK